MINHSFQFKTENLPKISHHNVRSAGCVFTLNKNDHVSFDPEPEKKNASLQSETSKKIKCSFFLHHLL